MAETKKAKFISEWDGGTEIETTCTVDVVTKKVFNIKKAWVGDSVDVLDGEFVEIDDERFPVYPLDEYYDDRKRCACP